MYRILFLLGLILLACGNRATPQLSEPQQQAEVVQQEIFNIGDTIDIDDYTITVNSVTEVGANDVKRPKEGFKFIVVDFTLTNKSNGPKNFTSLIQTTVKDDSGQVYKVDVLVPETSSVSGELVAGETIKGQVGFEIPNDAKGLQFVFDASLIGTGKAFIKIE